MSADKNKYKSLVNENIEYGDKNAALSVKDVVETTVGTVSVAKGTVKAAGKGARTIQTGVVKGSNGVRTIATRVNKVRKMPLTSANMKKITKSAGATGLKLTGKALVKGTKLVSEVSGNITDSFRDKVLDASIDKSTVTDTGIETIKQEITYTRYLENIKRTAENTAKGTSSAIKTSVKTARKIKSLPNDTKEAARKTAQTVKKTAVKTKAVAKAIESAGKKVVQFIASKGSAGVIIAVGVVFFTVIMFMLISGGFTSVITSVGGAFSWLNGGNPDGFSNKEHVTEYVNVIKSEVDAIQNEIDNVYNTFVCDRTEYPPYFEITEFRDERFKYDNVNITNDNDYAEIISMTAAKWYTDTLLSDTPPTDFKLDNNKIKEMIRNFCEFSYDYEIDYCPHHTECCKHKLIMTEGSAEDGIYCDTLWYCDTYYHGCKEIKEWYEFNPYTGEWDWDNKVSGSRTFCNRKHYYLSGGVKNYSADEVMAKLSLSDEEKKMYDIYYKAVSEWLAEE